MAARPPLPTADDYVALQQEHSERSSARWLLKIKELRVRHDVSIVEAERLAVADPVMRRWALKMINSNQQCRKAAQMHIRHNGDASLIEWDGSAYRYRD